MAGKRAAPLNLTERQRNLLEHYQSKRSTAQHQSKRIQIILKAAQGESTYHISKEIKMTMETVRKWRKRWAAAYEKLLYFENGKDGNGVSDLILLRRMLDLLKDEQRSGAPCRISQAEKQQLLAMACRKPSDYDIPITKWSHLLLAQTAVKEGIVDKISPRYVGKLLKKTTFNRIKAATGFIQK